MKNNLHSKNKERLLKQKKRHQAIHQLISENQKLRRHEDIILELKNKGIEASQSTVFRDLDKLSIKKNKEGYFELSAFSQKSFHYSFLYDLLTETNSSTAADIQTYFIKTENGKAQEIAFHIERAFPNIVLKTSIDLDSVLVFADGEEVTDKFLKVFEGEE